MKQLGTLRIGLAHVRIDYYIINIFSFFKVTH